MDWKELLFNEIKDLRQERQDHDKEVDGRLNSIEQDLKEHMRRTALAEKRIDANEEAIKPIKHHMTGLTYVLWAITSLLGLIVFAGSVAFALTKLGWV